MRPIDADSLKSVVNSRVYHNHNGIIKIIDEQPTINAVSSVHAHWECAPEDTAYDNVWVCSNCGEDFIQHSKPKIRYCPNCGAKMDEETEK